MTKFEKKYDTEVRSPELAHEEADGQRHYFHLVDFNPWPIKISFALSQVTLAASVSFHEYTATWNPFLISIYSTILLMALWFNNVSVESVFANNHTVLVQRGLAFGFGLFIVSEVMFFLSFFWANFHNTLAPTVEVGAVWPPYDLMLLNPFTTPLFNTILY